MQRISRIGLAVAAAALVAGGLQVVTPEPALAVPGLLPPVVSFAPPNALSWNAHCPPEAPRIVGGGGSISDGGLRRAFFKSMQPIRNFNNTVRDAFIVGVVRPPGFTGTINVTAYAMCAPTASVPGHEIIQGVPTSLSSRTAQDGVAVCTPGKRVIGFGGGVLSGGSEVGLQTVRSSGPRDISRVFAREDADGYNLPWQAVAFAVCMTTSDTRPPVGAAIPGSTGASLCPTSPSTFVHGPGGGAWDGIGLIHAIIPSADRRRTDVTITAGSTAVLVSTVCMR